MTEGTADMEAKAAIEEGNQVAAVRANQNSLINAFRDKYGLEPDDVCVDIRRMQNGGRLIWNVRKMSVAEREAQRQQQLRKDIEALKLCTQKTYVWVVVPKMGLWPTLLGYFRLSSRLHLTEKGANSSCGKSEMILKMEIKA